MEERIVKADPVTEPEQYQQEMVALLGGQDPVTVLAQTVGILRTALDGLSDEVLTTRPEPGEWSAYELLGHLWDAELTLAFRGRLILAQDKPIVVGYDQEAWARLPRPPAGELLTAFTVLRETNVELARQTPAEAWQRYGMHTERGPMTFESVLQATAGHDRAHLEQFRRTVAKVSR
jgi:hypothetical protein